MPENVQNCPLCQSQTSRPFDTRQFRGHPVHNRLCANCGLVFQSPRMTAAELDDFYAAEYRRVYQGDTGPSEKDLQTQKGRAASLLKFVGAAVPEVHRHLDLGCSAGVLLAAFRDHYGDQPIGVEPGDSYRGYAQSQGLTVYPDLGALAAAAEPPFDLISLAHVLEHLPDPVEYLAALRESHLTPGGWLLLEVPNLYCHDSFEIAHLTSFSTHTLRQTVERAGYEIVRLEAHGRPRSELLPLYLTVLARSRPRPISRVEKDTEFPSPTGRGVRGEGNVALKRRLGLLRRRVLQKLFPKKAWLTSKRREVET